MSKYTAFVAVSQNPRVEPNSSQKVEIPANLPEGMPPAMANPGNSGGSNSSTVPEPAEIFGSLAAILLLLSHFGWKRRRLTVKK
jgi:hypothetical protein